MPGWARIEACFPFQTMWQYGSSLKTATFLPRTALAIRARSSSVATPPVGLWGELRKIALGDLSSARNRSTAATSGRNWFAWLSGRTTARALPLRMFGK